MAELHGNENKDLSLFSLNRRSKKAAEEEANRTGQDCHLVSVLATVVSAKIGVKSRKSSNMKDETTLVKLDERLLSWQNEKDLGVIFEYSYSSYVNGVVPAALQVQQQAENSTPKGKKKSNTGASTPTVQLKREADVRESVRNEFDQRLDALMKLYRCRKQNCDNYAEDDDSVSSDDYFGTM